MLDDLITVFLFRKSLSSVSPMSEIELNDPHYNSLCEHVRETGYLEQLGFKNKKAPQSCLAGLEQISFVGLCYFIAGFWWVLLLKA